MSAICRRSRSVRGPNRPTGSRRSAPTSIPVRRSSSRRAWRCRSARGPRSSDGPDDFAVTVDGLYLWARHLAEVGSSEADFVAVAERFLHAPYLWGGRTSEGIDCSGLVQAGLTAAGRAAPRDSDQQEATIGEPVRPGATLTRGDLIFWKGHVGVMRDAATLLHANGWRMAVVSEPLTEARARIAASEGGDVTSVRRLAAGR